MTDYEGCYTFSGCYFLDSFIHINYSKMCPCTTCIIKMICKKICPERMDFCDRVEIDIRGF